MFLKDTMLRFCKNCQPEVCLFVLQPAGTIADALADIFMLTPRQELRQQAYRMVGVTNNRDFALAVEKRLNTYFAKEQRKLDRRYFEKVFSNPFKVQWTCHPFMRYGNLLRLITTVK